MPELDHPVICSVGPCQAAPVIVVQFHRKGLWFGYCRRHAYDRDGALRWATTATEEVRYL